MKLDSMVATPPRPPYDRCKQGCGRGRIDRRVKYVTVHYRHGAIKRQLWEAIDIPYA